MRYVSGLIPEYLKVLPDYFKEKEYIKTKKRGGVTALNYIGAIFFFLLALSFIDHFILTIFYGIIGFFILPRGHAFLEKKGRFKYTRKIKALSVALLFIISLPVAGAYLSADAEEARLAKLEEQRIEKQRKEDQRLKQIRKDSFDHLINTVGILEKENKLTEAESVLKNAQLLASTASEVSIVNNGKEELSVLKANELFKKRKYREALQLYTELARNRPHDEEILYNKAICHKSLREIQYAVNSLKSAMSLGSSKAEKLHEKINPIRKRIVGYRTLCCDGSFSPSNAKGRGACSHHGGVCNWNYPIYQEYRKYE